MRLDRDLPFDILECDITRTFRDIVKFTVKPLAQGCWQSSGSDHVPLAS